MVAVVVSGGPFSPPTSAAVMYIGEPRRCSGKLLTHGTKGTPRSQLISTGTVCVAFPRLGSVQCELADLVVMHNNILHAWQGGQWEHVGTCDGSSAEEDEAA